MSVLRQAHRTLIDFYNDINKKLTLLINKTIMDTITKDLNIKNKEIEL